MEGREEGTERWLVGRPSAGCPLPSFLYYSGEGDRRSGKELSDRDGGEEANDEESRREEGR